MEPLHLADPNVSPVTMGNIEYSPRRSLLEHIAQHRYDCSRHLIDPTFEIALVWKAFSNPERIGFLTHDRFNRLLAETTDYMRSLSPSTQNFLAACKENPATLDALGSQGKQLLHEELARNLCYPQNQPLLRKYGQMTKPGKIVRKLRPNAPDEEVEAFATLWRQIYEPQQTHIEILEDVPTAYNSSNYAREAGTIMSCMTNELDFVSFYNRVEAKVVVLKNQHDKILARAIYWPSVNFANGTADVPLMDRVYTTDEPYYEPMFKWAATNSVYRKFRQSYTSKQDFVAPDGRTFTSTAYIRTPLPNSRYYPYMDTFTYYDNDSGRFINTPDDIEDGLTFESTGGSYEHIYPDEVYVDGHGYIPEDDVVYLANGEPCYIDDAIMVGGSYYHIDNPHIVRTPDGEYIFRADAILTENDEYYHVDDPNLILTSDELWFHESDPEIGTDYVYTEDTNQYVHIDDTYESTISQGVYFIDEMARDRFDDEKMHARDRQLNLIA
jgi:hypothetical protein